MLRVTQCLWQAWQEDARPPDHEGPGACPVAKFTAVQWLCSTISAAPCKPTLTRDSVIRAAPAHAQAQRFQTSLKQPNASTSVLVSHQQQGPLTT